jgi:hypothetical protein
VNSKDWIRVEVGHRRRRRRLNAPGSHLGKDADKCRHNILKSESSSFYLSGHNTPSRRKIILHLPIFKLGSIKN